MCSIIYGAVVYSNHTGTYVLLFLTLPLMKLEFVFIAVEHLQLTCHDRTPYGMSAYIQLTSYR